jgi:hypothetical protein
MSGQLQNNHIIPILSRLYASTLIEKKLHFGILHLALFLFNSVGILFVTGTFCFFEMKLQDFTSCRHSYVYKARFCARCYQKDKRYSNIGIT